jgi:hypothetical protein
MGHLFAPVASKSGLWLPAEWLMKKMRVRATKYKSSAAVRRSQATLHPARFFTTTPLALGEKKTTQKCLNLTQTKSSI